MIYEKGEIEASFQAGYMTNVKMFMKEVENVIEKNKVAAV